MVINIFIIVKPFLFLVILRWQQTKLYSQSYALLSCLVLGTDRYNFPVVQLGFRRSCTTTFVQPAPCEKEEQQQAGEEQSFVVSIIHYCSKK